MTGTITAIPDEINMTDSKLKKTDMSKLRDFRKDAIVHLSSEGISSAQLDVDILLETVLGISKIEFITDPDMKIAADQQDKFNDLLDRRLAREPISQILGYKDFWKYRFKVTKDCLTPRPDSETLIEAVLNEFTDKDGKYNILDFGTGTGCLLLSLLGEYPNAAGLGVDISEKALDVACDNVKETGLTDRCEMLLSDWDQNIIPNDKYNIIISNPPYIAWDEKLDLDPDVREYEPETALFAHDQGLADYQKLALIIPRYLSDQGCAFMEIGYRQASQVTEIFKMQGANEVTVLKDLAGRDRCLVVKYNKAK